MTTFSIPAVAKPKENVNQDGQIVQSGFRRFAESEKFVDSNPVYVFDPGTSIVSLPVPDSPTNVVRAADFHERNARPRFGDSEMVNPADCFIRVKSTRYLHPNLESSAPGERIEDFDREDNFDEEENSLDREQKHEEAQTDDEN
ncbi:hypothetical protein VNI00_013383 [Paramarasmius palmivorus]|uniref:Uncharacterized protein n=1 Tax=Paramarasmius palmivorus TaxID=297713 RepID=A0AAW0C084_9AGAR